MSEADGNEVIEEPHCKSWYKNYYLHREGGPALEWTNGDKSWYQHGKLHREDGPAIEYINGYNAWFFKGKEMKVSCNEEFIRIMKLKMFW